MSDTPLAPTRRPWQRYLFLAGAVLLTALGWHFGVGNLASQIGGARHAPLLLMVLLILAGFCIRAWKWHYALGPGQEGVLLFFIAKTAGNWTPGRAGELAPLLLRRHRNARVAAWIGLDRAVEVGWTLGLGVLGVASVGLLSIPVAVCMVAGGVVAAGLAWFVCLGRGTAAAYPPYPPASGGDLTHNGNPSPKRLLEEIPLKARARGWRGRLASMVSRFREELILFGRKTPLIMILTAMAKLTDIYAVILLCDAFGYGVSFLLVCAARCAHGLVSAIPVTPDATGVPFVAAAWLLHAYAAMPYDTLTAALGLELIAINAILWACFCLVSGLRWNKTTNGSSSP